MVEPPSLAGAVQVISRDPLPFVTLVIAGADATATGVALVPEEETESPVAFVATTVIV